MREKGMGRTRLRRFAAVTVPATIASAGLGLAIVQGMVSATLSSANGFDLVTDGLTADTLAVAPGTAQVAGSTNGAATALARVGGAQLERMCVGVNQALPVSVLGLNRLGLDVISQDTSVELDNVDLNASDLTAGNSVLNDTTIGVAQSETAFAATAGQPAAYSANGFALQSTNVDMDEVASKAYAVTLSGGLSLSGLSLKPSLPASASTPTCASF